MTADRLPTRKAPAYRVYTTKFDRVVKAAELETVLGPMNRNARKSLDSAWEELQTGLLPWRTKLQVVGSQLSENLRSQLSKEQRNDIVVSLLIDQSGSMRGQKMLYSTATVDIAQEFLGALGIACEVLGFTTSCWRGGRSRRRWKWCFRPKNPGRLNDLLHVIYRDASDSRVNTGGWDYRYMLRPDLPKENIDGEAIEWAASRLCRIPKKRKILIILTDGAPVDDSTIMENRPNYLGEHLRCVVECLNSQEEIDIGAFGIGFEAQSFYPIRSHVEDPSELGNGLLDFISMMLVGKSGFEGETYVKR